MRNRVRYLREQAGLTMDQLGDRIGATRQTVSSIENGRYSPRLELAFAISRVFGKQIEEIFLEGEDDSSVQA